MTPLQTCPPEPSFPVVCLLASAGGLEPLGAFFRALPTTSGMAFLVLQHHAPDHPPMLAELLERYGAIPVDLAKAGDALRPDRALVLTSGMTLAPGDPLRVELQDALRSAALPGDLLFQSVAERLGERAIAIVLSGSGADGTAGLRAIRARGGLTLVQDPATAGHGSMPRHALDAGVVDEALPVARLVERVLQEPGAGPSADPEEDRLEVQAICAALAQRTGNDFSQYKPGTLNRRIQRRMLATGLQTRQDYLALVEDSEEEGNALLGDLLIGVTECFRDPEAFEALLGHLGPELRAAAEAPFRIWVPGCASGEEAYSLAILVQESLEELGSGRRVQIFATDIDPGALMQAKAGRYSEAALRNLSPERRRRFFTEEAGGWRVSKALRELCVFSLHNILRDPPFSSLNLISCRNVFIYLQPALQGKLIPLFHFALKPGGLLFLGRSEGVASQPHLFDPLDKPNRVFRRREAPRPPLEFPVGDRRQRHSWTPLPAWEGAEPGAPFAALGQFEQMLMKDYLPASAIVNELGDILLWAGQIGKYLNPVPGVSSSNLLNNLSGPLHWELRRLLAKAAGDRGGASEALVHHDAGHGAERLRLTVRPMPGMERGAMVYAVVIQNEGAVEPGAVAAGPLEADSPLLEQLNRELQTTRVELKAAVEELEATNEELQSSNEELQGSEEELRSVNEELTTLNQELNQKVGELHGANSDLQNLMASTEIPTLFLDRELRISRFTPAATRLFGLIEGDLGRPIRDLSPRFTGLDLPALAEGVLERHGMVEAQAQSLAGDCWFIVRLRPYRTPSLAVGGVVITFVDCTEIRTVQLRATDSEARYRRLFEGMVNGFAHCRMRFEGDRPADFQYLSVNGAFQDQTGLREVAGRWVSEVIPGIREQDPGLFERYGRVARTGVPERFETYVAALGQWFDVSVYSPRRDEFVAVFDVVTTRKRAEEDLVRSEEHYRTLFETVPDGVVYVDAERGITMINPAAERILGLTLEQLRDRVPGDAGWEAVAEDGTPLPPGNHPALVALRTGKPVEDLVVGLSNPQRGRVWISVNVVPQFRPGESAPYQVYCIFRDITERRRVKEQVREGKAKLEAALNSMQDAVFIVDGEGRFIEYNEAFAAFHRFRDKRDCPATLAGIREFTELLLPSGEPAPLDQRAVPRALRGETAANVEYGLRRRDTGEAWIGSYSFGPLRDPAGAILGAVVVVRDITESRRMEREIQTLNADLERRVAERTRALQAANRELEAFSYSVSHDLRAPLRAIDGFSHILAEEFGDRLDDEGRRYLMRVRSGTQRMGQLIDDMLKLSQINRMELDSRPLDLSAQAAQILERLAAGDPGRAVRTVVAPGLKAQGDPHLVGIALDNLLGNSWKYTGKNPEAFLEFGLCHQAGEPVFFVRDNGAGFDMQYADKLFSPFQRLHSPQDYEGSGIGLAIVQRIIDRHRGRIWAEAEPGKGATFFFTLAPRTL